ncbi:MAG: ABC transporter ATP-binding protein [Gordonia sp. (in: high G+C Gram-positive bacteria)]
MPERRGMPGRAGVLELVGLRVEYDGVAVIDGLSWSAGGDGALVTALLGPSGCGKSTLIRAVAGLERPAAGRIRFDGTDLARVPTHRRDFGVVFQDGQLFAGRSVAANIGYGLRMRRWSRGAVAERVEEMLDLVDLSGSGGRRVEELSGGQAQRVAVARALAPRPRLLLLDEPLAALDRRLREHLATQIADIVRAAGTPTIVVTHDHGEAALMAEQIAVMRKGAIVQTARPAELWTAPADEWTARFLGCTVVIEARPAGKGLADTVFGAVEIDVPAGGARLGLRAESLRAEPVAVSEAAAAGTVVDAVDLPAGPRLRVRTVVGEVVAHAVEPVAPGTAVGLRLIPQRVAVVRP